MAVRIDEETRVATPEGRRPRAGDLRARRLGLGDDGVDLLRRADIVGEGHAAPTSGVSDAAVLGELGAVPEPDDHPARLEEDDVVVGLRAGRPAERFVERARPLEIGHAEGDEREALLHPPDLKRAASSEPPVASPSLYEWAPAPASLPPSTIRYSSRIGFSSNQHSRISRVPAA